jgi:hypothetical protein
MQINRPGTPIASQHHHVDTATDDSDSKKTTSPETQSHCHPADSPLKKAPHKITGETSESPSPLIPKQSVTPERLEKFRQRMAEKAAEPELTNSEVWSIVMAAVQEGSEASFADQAARKNQN